MREAPLHPPLKSAIAAEGRPAQDDLTVPLAGSTDRLRALDETSLLEHRLVFPGKVKTKSLTHLSLDLEQPPCFSPLPSYVLPSLQGWFKEERK